MTIKIIRKNLFEYIEKLLEDYDKQVTETNRAWVFAEMNGTINFAHYSGLIGTKTYYKLHDVMNKHWKRG